jgi:ribosomal protein S18 acetylase RimI-like enzyme
MVTIELKTCTTPEQFSLAKTLTQDYMDWLGEDLCYQGIDKERDTFHIMYGKPAGCFVYVLVDNKIAGGVGVRKLEDGICEMKRLFVYDEFRGHKLGQILSEELLKLSIELGYSKMRLDTIPRLKNALNLYRDLGFYEIPSYYNNPDKSVIFFEKVLT